MKKWNLELTVKDNEQMSSPLPLVQYNNSNSIYSGGEAAPGAMNNQISRGAAGDRYKVTRNTQEVFTNCPNASLDGAGRSAITSLIGSPVVQAGVIGLVAAKFVEQLVFVAIIAAVAFFLLQKNKSRS